MHNLPLMRLLVVPFVAAVTITTSVVTNAAGNVTINPLPDGSVSTQEGLKHWARIYQVFSHPRCANCHTGASGIPMWSGPSYGQARPHGMNIHAGTTRIGAETLVCSTCHGKRNSTEAHGPPGVDMPWRLAPPEADWFGKTSVQICEQVRDPKRNGDRTYLEIAKHLDHDLILHWAWAPGPGREPAPMSLQENVNDILAWGAAGMPCPDN
jgi:mono/diheme cytochrome c family protein